MEVDKRDHKPKLSLVSANDSVTNSPNSTESSDNISAENILAYAELVEINESFLKKILVQIGMSSQFMCISRFALPQLIREYLPIEPERYIKLLIKADLIEKTDGQRYMLTRRIKKHYSK